MTAYKNCNTEKEFIDRTNKIINQYSNLEGKLGEKFYDVTLYLNCLLGLLVLPREWKLEQLSDKEIPTSIKNTLIKAVDQKNNKIEVTFKEYIIGLRNGIVHFGQKSSLRFINTDDVISSIEIDGERKYGKNKLYYSFNLENGNELATVIKEVLSFIN